MKKLLLLLLIITSLTACDTNDDDSPQEPDPISLLPPVTMTGENTFGFLLNGEPINITNTSNQFAIYQGGGIQLGAGGIRIVILDPFTENTEYEFRDIGSGTARARMNLENEEGQFCLYNYEDTYSGTVTISFLDRTNYIISGIFEFSTNNQDCENLIITNGRFDLQYIP